MLVNIAALSMSENEPFCIVLNGEAKGNEHATGGNGLPRFAQAWLILVLCLLSVLPAVIMFSCLPVLLGSCTASSRVLTASLAFLSASIALSLAYLIVIVTSDEEDWNIILQIVAFVLLMLIAASVYDARQWMMREQAAERMQESQASVPLAEAAAPTSSSSTPSLTPRRVTFLPPSAVRSLSGHSSFSLSRGGALGQAIEIQGAPNRPRSPSLRQGLSDASSSSSSSSVAAESKSDMV